MTKHRNSRFVILAGIVLLAGGMLLAQSVPDKVLIVNGKSVGPILRQIDGHSYVDVETLAHVTNGVITIEPTRVVLTIPAAEPLVASGGAVSAAAQGGAAGVSGSRLSREFASAAISELEEMREFRGAVTAMITYGLAANSAQAKDLHDQVEAGLDLATVAAATDGDRSAAQLLRNEYDVLTSWSDGVFTDRQNLNGARTVDANSLAKDAVLAQIKNCGQFLNGMIVSGAYSDNSSCH